MQNILPFVKAQGTAIGIEANFIIKREENNNNSKILVDISNAYNNVNRKIWNCQPRKYKFFFRFYDNLFFWNPIK